MDKKFLFALIFFGIFIILISLLFTLSFNIKEPVSYPDNYVTQVIDGDTFKINTGEVIRLLCVDAPEKTEQYYEEAKEFLEDLILNKEVILNSSETDKDIYGRLLRFVYINDTLVNKEILNQEFGSLYVIPPEDCSEVVY